MILSQALAATLSKGPGNTALRFLDKDYTYKDLVTTVSRFSYLFQKEIGHKARVAFIGSNCPAFVTSFFALSNTCSIMIPIDPGLCDNDIDEWVYDTHPTHIMVTSDLVPRIRDLLRRRGVTAPLIEIEKKKGGEYATSYVPPADQVPKDKDPILLLRTAGTAGKYKYALFNHLQVQAAATGLKKAYRAGSSDRFLTQLSWAHPFAFVHGMFFPIMVGSTCVIDHGLEGSEFLTFLTQSKITRLIGFTNFFERILTLCRSFERSITAKSITVSMGTLSQDVARGFASMNVKIAHCYGQTENLWSVSMSDTQDADSTPRSLMGVQYKVLDAGGDAIEDKGRRAGPLAIISPAMMIKYEARNQKAEDETKKETQSVIRGTWLYTGDVFTLDGSGDDTKLTFSHRKDGFNPLPKALDGFDPSALERTFKKQEGIADFATFQIGGSKGNIICAIVLKEECTLSQHQILEAARPFLTPKNFPTELMIMAAIPRDANQAVDVPALEKMYEESQGKKAA